MKYLIFLTLIAFKLVAQQAVMVNTATGVLLNTNFFKQNTNTLARSAILSTNGIGDTINFFGTNRFNGKIRASEPSNSFPDTTFIVGNPSTIDDSEAFRAFRNVTLDRNLLNQFTSSYNAWHLNLNGFNAFNEIFPFYAAYQMEGTNGGGASYASAGKLYTIIKSDSNVTITNMIGLNISLNNGSTVGGTAQTSRGIYIRTAGAGTNGSIIGLDIPTIEGNATGNKVGIQLGQQVGPNNFALRIVGGASNYITGGTRFTDKIYSDTFIQADTGSAAAPSISFSTDNTTGLYRPNGNAIGITTAGVGRIQVNSSGHVLPIVDATSDLGSGTFRFKSIYASSDITGGNDITAGAAGAFFFNGRGRMSAQSDGVWRIQNTAVTRSATLSVGRPVLIKSTNYPVAATEANTLFLNSGASLLTFTLPTGYAGGYYSFKVDAIAGLTIAPQSGQSISFQGQTATNTLSSTSLGSNINVTWDGFFWQATSATGTWFVDGSFSGNYVSILEAIATADQQISNTTNAITLDTTTISRGPGLTRSGPTVITSKAGAITMTVQAQIRQDQNNNLTTIFFVKNGVAIGTSGSRYSAAAANDQNVLFILFTDICAAGDTYQVQGITSVANGATLDYNAAAAPVPAVAAAIVDYRLQY